MMYGVFGEKYAVTTLKQSTNINQPFCFSPPEISGANNMMKFLALLDFLPPFAVRISLQLQCHATQQTTSRSQSWNVTRLAGGLLYIIVRYI